MNASHRLWLELQLWKHGWGWPLAASLILAAALGWAFVVSPMERALHVAQEQQRAAPVQARPLSADPLTQVQVPLRNAPTTAQQVQLLVALAEENGIRVSQASYEQEFRPELGMRRTQVTQPVRASYAQFRRYIERVLRDIPNASLDGVSVRRDDVAQDLLDIRLRWSLWHLTPALAGTAPP